MKTLEKLTKKELIELITTIRPKADAYERVCKELGIENDILTFIKKLTIPRPINSLPDFDEYIITSDDSEERYFANADTIENAITIYKNWSRGESVMANNTSIYKVVDITDELNSAKLSKQQLNIGGECNDN